MAYASAPAALFIVMGPPISFGATRVLLLLPFVLLLAIIASRRLRDIGLPWRPATILFILHD